MNLKINSFEEYQKAYALSVAEPELFWKNIAEQFHWQTPFKKVLEWEFNSPEIQWFIGGKTNICYNAIDRHLPAKANDTALIWEPNNPDDAPRNLTYAELHEMVCKLANVLRAQGVTKGDRVAIYMPMVPEVLVAMLACARIGAIHSVVFAGFSPNSLADRINDSECKVLITADGGNRGAKTFDIKALVDEALQNTPSIEKCIVFRHIGNDIPMRPGRDLYWDDEMRLASADCPVEWVDSEHPLFILYTSGSTGKPKGVVHTTGGYMVYTAYTFANVFQYYEGDVFWCTADVGWITGHSYLTYGPLLNAAKSVVFEGVPTWPDASRFWQAIERHKVNIFYTAPTAIRSLMTYDEAFTQKYNLSSLKVLGSVGEPINEEAWHWYNEKIGSKRCPIVDTWWQTETGGILISPLAGITPLIPCEATLPLPGVQPILVDANGNEITEQVAEGNLCIKFPWPSIIRTTWGDHSRCHQNYFATYPGIYFTGDGARRDANGNFRILGRVDDVINVSGHRMGTAEVENAINEHPAIIESAVVGYPHEIKGQGIFAYVIARDYHKDHSALRKEVLEVVSKIIGPIAKPDKLIIVNGLPKTRSGKIMRRILRKIAENDLSNLGDTSTLLDPAIVEHIKEQAVLQAD